MAECVFCHQTLAGVQDVQPTSVVVTLHAHPACYAEYQKTCPQCNQQLKTPFFSVLKLPGYVCDQCHMFFDTNMRPLAFLP